jgi:hypothetical protein
MQNESDSHRLDQLTPEAPIKRLRLGYPGTGYSFYLTRCLDAKAFTKHVHEADLDRKHKVKDAIDAKCYPLYGSVLPGTIDEAVVDTLCEIHIVVIAQEDLRVERRSWRHEIGHAADFARQAFLITLMNPKAIVFYMAFFPLFIDAGQHRGFVTFAAMAVTIALVTLAYCLTLCAFASAISERVRTHHRLSLLLQRAAGVALIGFGLKLAR